jgi:hypothetical protein
MAGERRNRAGVSRQTMDAAAGLVLAENVPASGPDVFDQVVDGAVALVGPRQRVRQAARSKDPQARR